MNRVNVEIDNINNVSLKYLDEVVDSLNQLNNISLNVPKNFSHAKYLSTVKLDIIVQRTDIRLYMGSLRKKILDFQNNENKYGSLLLKKIEKGVEKRVNIIKGK